MVEKTIIYYTHNRENSCFENKIMDNIKAKAGDIPIISVSQKPIDMGRNICVGDVGLSYLNEWRQILIGAKEANSKFLIFCESDVLYPKEYFQFMPPSDGIWRYDNVWMCFYGKGQPRSFRRKKYTEGAQICSRNYVIDRIEEQLLGQPLWYDGREYIKDNGKKRLTLRKMPFEFFHGNTPLISFKTGNGVRASTGVMKGREYRKMSLPGIGSANDLRRMYICD